MSQSMSQGIQRESGETYGDWQRYPESYRRRGGLPIPGLLVGGLVVAGLGALAWYYFGPDLRRYLKIRNM